MKSPMGSVSSSESVCSAEVGMSDLPLLAAVAGSAAPIRTASRRRPRGPSHSENGSSMSSDGEDHDSSMSVVGESTPSSRATCPYSKMRKLDSPDDSGIESGVDRYEKLSTTSRSTTTSLCSSPRSSLDDKVKDVDDVSITGSIAVSTGSSSSSSSSRSSNSVASSGGRNSVDDMPVLKRVLQAPPLFDTNSLMDEAYKPHKKFRALTLQRKSDPENGSHSAAATLATSGTSGTPGTTPVTSYSSSNHSVLSTALSSPVGTTYSNLCSVVTSTAASSSSLTSTHSTLARSLMEAPKSNSEQLRRADLIVANIMKGAPSASSYSAQSPYAASGQRTVLTSGHLYTAAAAAAAAAAASSANNNSSWMSSYIRPSNSSSSSGGSSVAAADPVPTQTPSASGAALPASSGDSQPLNLSLKSPSSSPDRSTTPVTHAPPHYFPLHA